MGHSKWLTYKEKNIWRQYLHHFFANQSDVYFLPEYSNLYATEVDLPCCFIYNENDSVFFYPFLQSKIPQNTAYYDISTSYGYGGPLCNVKDQLFINKAYNMFHQEAKQRNIIAERIRFHPIINNHKLLQGSENLRIFNICPTVHVELDCSEDYRWSNIYTHANRKTINKAVKNGVEIYFGQESFVWDAFHLLYRETMLANQAQSFYYFHDDYYTKIQNDLASNYILVYATLNSEIISVLIVLLGSTVAHCHRIGTNRGAMSLGTNNLLHHETILWCKSKGLLHLLIGGGRGNTEADPLYLFKKNFSNVSGNFHVGEYIINNEIYNLLCDDWCLNNSDKKLSTLLFKYRF